ncbi:MAG: DUF1491 family protein [Pseudomonadota bacterium]
MTGTPARLPTKLWVDALLRRANLSGAGGFVLRSGDADRGDVLVKVATLDGEAALYAPGTSLEGARIFLNLALQGVGPAEGEVDAYIERARSRDPDIWIVEIEDKLGRHFLTEPVDGP